ncbi:MAG: SLBB domain-containing protein, partial [Syntrophales bacterium]|nr:SLBB domain-containing protein [Syntrophales bacterium]
GKYEMKPGMRLGDLLKTPEDLLPETYFDYGLIKRLVPPEMKTILVPFNLGDLLLKKDPAANITLMPQDQIFIFHRFFFKDRPYFTVEGEVRHGGRFDLAENFRVSDAILAAGGLTKEAYLKKAEIVRVNKNREYQHLYFNVDKALAGDPENNHLLQDEDRITIHSLWDDKWKETVTIAGEVKRPHTFTLTENMRVSDLVFKAGGITRDSYMEEAEIYRTEWNTKKVTLEKINLQKALDGDPQHNIVLKDLDRLVVHSIWETIYKKTVTVSGDVHNPGTYQYAENMTVRDLVFTAGNILESAYVDDAEISSLLTPDRKMSRVEVMNINLRKALEGDPAHNVPLKPYDHLFVRRIPNWNERYFVTLTGEFKFPGRYAIRKGEHLSSVIERAGGYLPTAYLRGAYFTREKVRELQQKSLDEMTKRMERELLSEGSIRISSSLSTEEIAAKQQEAQMKQKLVDYMRSLKATGRMTIALSHLRLLKGSLYDIELEDGDTLHIPKKNSVVNVVGAVMSEGSHIYDERLSYRDYIDRAGGYARYADEGNVFVVKVDGSARRLGQGFTEWNDKQERWELTS